MKVEIQGRPISLPSELSEQARLFARTYDFSTGGYRVPPRDRMPSLSEATVDEYTTKIPPTEQQWDSIELEVALFLYSHIRLTGSKRVIETGTSRGLSTCFLAAAVSCHPEGQVITLDPATVPHLWEGSELEHRISWIQEISVHALRQVQDRLAPEGQVDMLFLDSLHSYENLCNEIQIFEPLLKIGGSIFLHDTLYYDCLAPIVRDMANNPRFEVVTFNSPRTHGRFTRSPGITICTKVSDDPRFPIEVSREATEKFGNREIVNLPGRTDLDRSLLDLFRAHKILERTAGYPFGN